MFRFGLSVLVCLLMFGNNLIRPAEAKSLQRLNFGVSDNYVLSLATHPHNYDEVWIGTNQELYQSIDNGQTFQFRYRIPKRIKDVQMIHIPACHSDKIYISNRHDVYMSEDNGFTWREMTEQQFLKYKWIYAIASYQDQLFIATDQGVLYRETPRNIWQWLEPSSLNDAVYHLLVNGQSLYAVTAQKVYRVVLAQEMMVKNILEVDSPVRRQNNADSQDDLENDESNPIIIIRPLYIIDHQQESRNVIASDIVLVATQDRIYYQHVDQGQWNELFFPFNQLGEINDMIFFSPDNHLEEPSQGMEQDASDIELFGLAGSNRGVFRYRQGYWTPNYVGSDSIRVLRLHFNRLGYVFYGTDNGVYVSPLKEIFPDFFQHGFRDKQIFHNQFLQDQWSQEPSISTVQHWAIRYADVHPDKIQEWKKKALRQAWLPNLSIGVDVDKNRTMSDSIWGSYSGGGQHYLGPDDKTFYNNLGFGLNVSWDLGDVVWSTDLTTIDSRAKINVELREDILNQVTRLYFERRRVQLELLKEDVYEFYGEDDKELRLAEITALLDAYTGGQFTQALKSD
ncbi:MAG: hypothetical protein K8S27_10740 [Candidatus Omnitrophica bacterium]|nr:hypothetical protein [Candidatus Omnitrophota bacterium]